MLGTLARGMYLVVVGLMIAAYALTALRSDPPPPPAGNEQVIIWWA